MWTLRRPDGAVLKHNSKAPAWHWRRHLAIAATSLLLLLLVPVIQAQANNPQRAIETLEGCTAKERKSGCIKILKRQSAGGNKQSIKAQVRGGRIIWYEYNKKSGAVRRTN